jgi:hypothetical protein
MTCSFLQALDKCDISNVVHSFIAQCYILASIGMCIHLLLGMKCWLAHSVVLYYDYVLTFSTEVERFWTQQKFSWASLFFYLNRYVSLLGHLPVFAENFSKFQHDVSTVIFIHLVWLMDDASPAKSFGLIINILQLFLKLLLPVTSYLGHEFPMSIDSSPALFVMRLYALYNQSRAVLIFCCFVNSCMLVLGCVRAWTSSTPLIRHLMQIMDCSGPSFPEKGRKRYRPPRQVWDVLNQLHGQSGFLSLPTYRNWYWVCIRSIDRALRM